MKLVRESILNENGLITKDLNLEKNRFETQFGYIDYGYNTELEKYPEGIFVFMGSYVYKEYRGQGKFKEMVKELLNKFPDGTTVQVPVENKVLRNMFERLGFYRVKSIEHWGELGNAVLMQGTLDKQKLELL